MTDAEREGLLETLTETLKRKPSVIVGEIRNATEAENFLKLMDNDHKGEPIIVYAAKHDINSEDLAKAILKDIKEQRLIAEGKL